jgi:succinate dehydrogenase / fumarate reductase membrane anchor subunit
MGDGTQIGRVRGLGSAHEGVHHWMLQRYTAAGNLIAVGFLVVSFVLLPDLSYETLRGWAAQPLVATLLGLLLVSVFWHARLGLQVLAEDYLPHPGARFAAILVLNLAAFAGAGFGLLCVLVLALGSAQ